jgi:hypothetical protein
MNNLETKIQILSHLIGVSQRLWNFKKVILLVGSKEIERGTSRTPKDNHPLNIFFFILLHKAPSFFKGLQEHHLLIHLSLHFLSCRLGKME